MHVRDDETALKSHDFSLVGMMRRAVNRKALQLSGSRACMNGFMSGIALFIRGATW